MCCDWLAISELFPPQTAITIMNKSSQDAHTILDYHPTHYCCYFPLLIHSTCPKEMKIAVCHDDWEDPRTTTPQGSYHIPTILILLYRRYTVLLCYGALRTCQESCRVCGSLLLLHVAHRIRQHAQIDDRDSSYTVYSPPPANIDLIRLWRPHGAVASAVIQPNVGRESCSVILSR